MKTEELYLNIINNLCDGVYFVDTERTIAFWNKAAEEITGYSAEEIIGRQCQNSMLNHIDTNGRPLCTLGCPLFATLIDGEQRKETVYVRHKKGHRFPIRVNIFPVWEDGKITGAIEIFTRNSPIVYEDDLVEHLTGIAMHDALTNLPNRRYLENFLDYKLSEYKRFDKAFAVLFADIDDFSKFNNNYGHDIGDRVLVNIAESLMSNVRKNDLVGRWGGEELVGIYSLNKSYEASIIAEKFWLLIANTDVQAGNQALHVSASVGVTAVMPSDTVASLIERADQNMYTTKKNGKNGITVK